MRRRFSKLIERFIETILLISGTFTSVIVLLIILFLFSEGAGLFRETPMEKGNVVAVNSTNPVNALSPAEFKDIFDQKTKTWSSLGGTKDSIKLFRVDDIASYYTEEQIGSNFEHLGACISELITKTPNIIAFIPAEYAGAGFKGKVITLKKITIGSFISDKEWFPTAQPVAQFGVLSLILGTLWVSLAAIAFALPLGLATAIYLAEIADSRVRNILKPLIELLAGIPSVVYGFFGLIVIVPLIKNTFGLDVGETALAGSIILGIMALPTIITVSEDALRNTPRAMKEASLALGATKWQTIYKVSIPYSASGITAGAILGIGRAIGETMAVLMVTGNSAIIPHSLLQPVRTIPATIAAELGEAAQGGLHYKALFALGCILFIITFAINLSVEFISAKRKGGKE
ncbi:MAG TPA: phosphate ABC transporter permease subunit PstC [Bacteroidia bacterium]|jgi:phosphate transport system permease protein|nr:phosphate ABC transporter permease subunit PstC [Bacteroidia bacterium]